MIARSLGWGPIAAVVVVFLLLGSSCHSLTRSDSVLRARQWQVTELTFAADHEYSDPFDFETTRFSAVFRSPDGREFVVPGFWDGGTTWRIRFTPTTPGRWVYATHFANETDGGLHGRHGALDVDEPTNETALRRHGGFLAVSDNHRYLTYTDGTPFFWLGDTWWRVPSSFVPFEHFRTMVDARVEQGFTVFQAHGHTGFEGKEDEPEAFQSVLRPDPRAVAYWRERDRYIAYSEQRGLIGIVGFAAHAMLDRFEIQHLKRLWWYFLARYAAYPITFLITQEYNADLGSKSTRVSTLLQLGHFIRGTDPYDRAMSIHPWHHVRDTREAWSEPWYDFVMLQGGHFGVPACTSYLEAYNARPRRPILESESNYEGFVRGDMSIDDVFVRRAAYTAIQCGSFGFTYGAQGLYAGVERREEPGPTAKWGPVLTWSEGLSLPGSRQLSQLRTLYESIHWWKLEPWPVKGQAPGTLVKSDGLSTIVVYLPASSAAQTSLLRHADIRASDRYQFRWFDPRNGEFCATGEIVVLRDRTIALPARPGGDDWVLVLKRLAGATTQQSW